MKHDIVQIIKSAKNLLSCICTCMVYLHILYFAWADQGDKVCFLFHKVQGCCMDKKHSCEINLLLFLLNSAFQKVTIAFLRTSITLDSWL